jgi:hypothetical protein
MTCSARTDVRPSPDVLGMDVVQAATFTRLTLRSPPRSARFAAVSRRLDLKAQLN